MEEKKIRAEVESIFDSEKWSRFQLSEYNLSKFKNLEELILKINQAGLAEEVRQQSEEAIKQNEYNLSGLFLLAVMNFESERILKATKQFYKLVTSFVKKEKFGIVEYLSRKMLEYGDERFALENLIQALKSTGNLQEIPDLQERLVVLNPDETDTLVQIAQHKQKEKKDEDAVKYYMMALKNYLKDRNRKRVEELWSKIIELAPDYMQRLMPFEEDLQASFEKEFINHLYMMLTPGFERTENWDVLIQIYKKVLVRDPDNRDLRTKLIDMYQKKYEKHTQFNQFLIYSGLKQWWQDIFQAIEKFEKYIKFDVDKFVFHQGWGVGKIRDIQGTDIFIDFPQDENHKMTFEMAMSSLQVLADNNIKVHMRYHKDDLVEDLKKDPVRIITLIIKDSPDGIIGPEQIKAELTAGLIKPDEWNKWWTRAKNKLRLSDHFDFRDNKTIVYIENPVSVEERIRYDFESADSIDKKIEVVSELLAHDKKGKLDQGLYQNMADYFTGLMNKEDSISSLKSYLVLARIQKVRKKIKTGIKGYELKKNMPAGEDLRAFFNSMTDNENKKLFVSLIEETCENPAEIFAGLLYTHFSTLHLSIFEKVRKESGKEKTEGYIKSLIEKYRDYPDLFFWIAKNLLTKTKDFQEYDLNEFTIYTNLISLVSQLGRKIRNGEKEEENSKLQKNIIALLFSNKEPLLVDFVVQEKKEGNSRIDNLIDLITNNKYLPDKYKKNLLDHVRNLEKMIFS